MSVGASFSSRNHSVLPCTRPATSSSMIRRIQKWNATRRVASTSLASIQGADDVKGLRREIEQGWPFSGSSMCHARHLGARRFAWREGP
jgi:hypothetical protein